MQHQRFGYLPLVTTIFAASLSALVACQGKSGGNNAAAPTPGQGGAAPGGTTTGGKQAPGTPGGPGTPKGPGTDDKNPAKPAADDYVAKGGDQYTLETQSKIWKSTDSEPAFGATTSTVTTVVARYKDGLDCHYRTSTVNGSEAPTFQDIGCEQVSCSVPDCTTKDIEDADVGTFKAAKGQETTCRFVTALPTGQSVTKSVTKSWTHTDALREAHVVKSDSASCQVIVAASVDAKTLDPCAPAVGTVAAMAHSVSTLSAQTHGSGTTDLTQEASGNFAASGAFTEPANAKGTGVSCSLASGKLTVSISKAVCNTDHTQTSYSLTVSDLDPAGGTDLQASPYKVGFSGNASFYSNTQGDSCTTSLTSNADQNWLSGSATCASDALTSSVSGLSEAVTGVTFGCFAPTGFFN